MIMKIRLFLLFLLSSCICKAESLCKQEPNANGFWISVLQIVAGAVISIVFVVWMEYVRQPKLKLSIVSPVDKIFDGNYPARKFRSLRLCVSNKNLPFLLRWLLRIPAQNCYGKISFHMLDGQNVFGREMQIRWTDSPEPTPIFANVGGQPALIYDTERLTPRYNRDVFPGTDGEILDVAVRFDSDNECYGWSNESYFSEPKWRNPKWKLDAGIYLVRVEIFTTGKRIKETFRLINNVTISDFRLEKQMPNDPTL
jgi:hypothetical protein